MQKKRLGLSPEFRREAASQVWHRLSAFTSRFQHIALYWSLASELSTREIFSALQSQNCRLYLPRLKAETLMEFVRVTEVETLVPTEFGPSEPHSSLPSVPLAQIQLVLVPGLAFDQRGYRLGWGNAYYDRMLKDFKGISVGLSYDFQIVEQLPYEDHDVPIDIIVSEKRWMDVKSASSRT